MSTSFILEYWLDDGWYGGRLRGVPGVFSQGETLDELEANIREAYQLMLEDEEPAPAGFQTWELAV
jgi:predicted RNase H-like HicB family nuclease